MVQQVHHQLIHKTGKPYGIEFPIVTIKDMVNAQRRLINHLGIEKLLTVVGGSMGGMQVLQWMVSYPEQDTFCNSNCYNYETFSSTNRLQ